MTSNIIKEKIIPAFLGVSILSFAIVLLINTGLGASAWDAFYVNLSIVTGLSFGFYSYSVGFILILLNTVISKKKFNWSALLMAFFIGNSVDLFNKIFGNAINFDSLFANVVVFIIGIILYGLGIAFLIYSNMPSPLEEYQFAIQKLFKVSTGTSKFYSDLSAFIAAVLVGVISKNGLGQISLGTLVITLVVGKIVGTWFEILNKYTRRIQYDTNSTY